MVFDVFPEPPTFVAIGFTGSGSLYFNVSMVVQKTLELFGSGWTERHSVISRPQAVSSYVAGVGNIGGPCIGISDDSSSQCESRLVCLDHIEGDVLRMENETSHESSMVCMMSGYLMSCPVYNSHLNPFNDYGHIMPAI